MIRLRLRLLINHPRPSSFARHAACETLPRRPAIIEPSPSFVAVREAKGVATPYSPGLISHPPSPWPSPWAGTSPTMSLARQRQRSWSASLSLPVACSLVMILGKQLCDTTDRECDAQPAAASPIVPIPVILAAVCPCAFSGETREGEREGRCFGVFLGLERRCGKCCIKAVLSLHRKPRAFMRCKMVGRKILSSSL